MVDLPAIYLLHALVSRCAAQVASRRRKPRLPPRRLTRGGGADLVGRQLVVALIEQIDATLQ